MNRKRIETVVLNESEKGNLLKDITDFLGTSTKHLKDGILTGTFYTEGVTYYIVPQGLENQV